MRLSNKIVLASLNPHKFFEFRSLLASYADIELVSAEGLIRNPEKLGFAEQYNTYLENAAAKARLANQASHYPSLSDDTGLEVNALDGRPGIKTHRYAAYKSGMSQDEANIEKLLGELKGRPSTDRGARFVATLALVIEGVMLHATATLEGAVAEAPRGKNGFGYDPIFIPKGSQKTLAEMTDAEKNGISHRGKALHELMAQTKSKGIIFAKP